MSKIIVEKPSQNWTKFPNSILDNLDKIDNASFKILGYMIRQTLGFKRDEHIFAYSYLIKNCGIKGKETICKSLKNLINLGIIVKLNESHYKINWSEDGSSKIELFENRTDDNYSSSKIEPEDEKTVRKSNTLKENIKERDDLKKIDYSVEIQIIDYWNNKNSANIAQPVKKNNSILKDIKTTINQYSYDELINCIDNMFNDKWSKDNGHIRLNRLIKADKRDQNMFKYKGKSEHINDEERVQAILAARKQFEGLNDTRKR